MDITRKEAQHDALLWEIINSNGGDKVFNDEQKATMVTALKTTFSNLDKFVEVLPLEMFIAMHFSFLGATAAYIPDPIAKNQILQSLAIAQQRIQDSMA